MSRDGGATWRVVAGGDGLSNATFSAGGDGWAVSSFGRHLVRWNGSEWARMRDPCSGGEIVDISFPQSGEGTGWLACSWGGGAGQELKGVFETRDGGSSWDPRTLVRPDEASLSVGKGLGGYGYVQAISFQPDGAVGSSNLEGRSSRQRMADPRGRHTRSSRSPRSTSGPTYGAWTTRWGSG